MSTQHGKINVQTENIFPIIKKFLYSDHEIFLRELVANAVDATQKLKTLNTIAEKPVETGELFVEVIINKDEKTLTVRDRGVGMTGEEIEKYINQIAFSGAEEFVNKYKDQATAQLIGKFGLGFYSAFMVSDKVEIHSRSWQAEEADAVRWSCDGSPSYTLDKEPKPDRGTDIILNVNEESAEFLEPARIKTLLKKYCGFLPVEIRFEGEKINNTEPAWVKKPADLKDEDYRAFYKELYPFAEEPLFWIHLNVDYPFNLTGILYFPKLKKNLEVQKNKIQLYCKQVFVTDAVEGIVPDFLTLLHGVIDSPDIPLNVSRSYLQSDSNVKKISNHILKKVADKLEELFKENRTDFEAKWDDIGVFIKYGMLSEEKFYDRAAKFCLLKNVDKKYFTFEEYRELVKVNQEDKDKKFIYLYSTQPEEQHIYVEGAKNKGYDVLWMDGVIDTHFVNFLEQKLEGSSFARVDADTVDKLINKEESKISVLNEEQQNALKEIAESVVNKEIYHVNFESLTEKDAPVMLTRPEFMRRMKEMSATGGGYSFMGEMPDQYNLVVNNNHPLMSKILTEENAVKKTQLMQQAIDLALLGQGLLKGEAMSNFMRRSVEMLGKDE
ncbi:MAG: molecular chaperone HtpG [Bacteroidetes bacterium]|nr:molecular chaperone HtpG [Bacteroidota bacterium]